jgi:hypothetical protein
MRSDWQFQGNRLRGFVRVIVAVVGSWAIAWAVLVYPALRYEFVFAAAAQHILMGEQYSAAQLNELRSQLDSSSANSYRASTLNDSAVIRLRLVEAALAVGQARAADLNDLQRSIDAELDRNPSKSFVWLTDYWLQKQRSGGAPADLSLLRMSDLTGPNEGWIAIRRVPLALDVFPSLSAELKDRTLAEFAGLVRSGLYEDAANILTGPGWPTHDRLLDGLAGLNEGDRRWFAKVLEAKDIEGLAVPGVNEPGARPAPSFDVPR